MPTILPIRDLRNTAEISELAHKINEPIFVTKNGYGDLVIMSVEQYESIVREARIDLAIQEAEFEVEHGGKPISIKKAKAKLDSKHYGSL